MKLVTDRKFLCFLGMLILFVGIREAFSIGSASMVTGGLLVFGSIILPPPEEWG